MNKEVKFHHNPDCEGYVAHKVIYKLKIVYSSMTGQ